MANNNNLREMVASMLMLLPEQIRPETPLNSLDNSIGGSRLKFALKRLGLSLPPRVVLSTYGELETVLFGRRQAVTGLPGSSTGSIDPAVERTHGSSPGARIGLDLQEIDSLPVATDYWEHAFYAGNFSRSEIAYAVEQSEPRTHFAGFWSAKEALRKCDPSFAQVDFESINVAHEANGEPYLIWQHPSGHVRLPHGVSLSHSGKLATAAVITMTPAPIFKPDGIADQSNTAVEPTESVDSGSRSRVRRVFPITIALIVFADILYHLLRYF